MVSRAGTDKSASIGVCNSGPKTVWLLKQLCTCRTPNKLCKCNDAHMKTYILLRFNSADYPPKSGSTSRSESSRHINMRKEITVFNTPLTTLALLPSTTRGMGVVSIELFNHITWDTLRGAFQQIVVDSENSWGIGTP
jgi:hypothetical protein